MLRFIAHTDGVGPEVAESATHFLENWYYALPLFILLVVGVATIAYHISKRSMASTYFSIVGMLLIGGIYLYDKSPVISALAITVGLFGSLLGVLVVLSGPKKK